MNVIGQLKRGTLIAIVLKAVALMLHSVYQGVYNTFLGSCCGIPGGCYGIAK